MTKITHDQHTLTGPPTLAVCAQPDDDGDDPPAGRAWSKAPTARSNVPHWLHAFWTEGPDGRLAQRWKLAAE
ncbi:MAG: hypothetical protein H7Y32_17375 [Chloroflexales bacterium]|nr:hypothetical protein [Chloroflexales bacterium]